MPIANLAVVQPAAQSGAALAALAERGMRLQCMAQMVRSGSLPSPSVRRHRKLTPWRHEELTPLVRKEAIVGNEA
ncbi:MAG: hypothetical protein LDL16_02510, partial [Thiobacillus sp.]|nr:hypothetical protein [Thiobacillus sp.]